MAVVLEEQDQYKQERNKILKDMRSYYKSKQEDHRPHVTSFVNELTKILKEIQRDPCRFPDYPAPVKKALFSKGSSQCVILFSPLPTNHMNNSALVTRVLLSSIMRTNSGAYNSYVMGQLEDCDLDV